MYLFIHTLSLFGQFFYIEIIVSLEEHGLYSKKEKKYGQDFFFFDLYLQNHHKH